MITFREERPGDEEAIRTLTAMAFAGAEHSDGSEPAIIARLRTDGDLTLSLVAQDVSGAIVAHAAYSAVTIDGIERGWFGLGPVSVMPERQGVGLGSALIERGLARLREEGARGCVVLGDPAFYQRFGFRCDPQLRYLGPPPEYFQRLVFTGTAPQGLVAYAPGFGA